MLPADIVDQENEEDAATKSQLKILSNKLLLVTRAAGIGTWEFDPHRNHFNIDDILFDIYGIDPLQFDGSLEMWSSFIHQKDKEYFLYKFQQALLNEPTLEINFRIIRADGEIRFIKAITIVEEDELGRVTRLFGTNQDITACKITEFEIRDSEEKYLSFFENSLDGILITVTGGRILHANPAACKMFGMTEVEICTAGRSGIIHTANTAVAESPERRQQAGKEELTFIRKDGSRFPGEVTTSVYIGAGGVERTSMIICDITERKQSEQQLLTTATDLKKALTEAEKIIHSSPDIICTIDEEGTFVNVSSAATGIWGYEPQELRGRKYLDFVFADDIEKTKEVAVGVKRGVAVTMFENRYVKKGGGIVPMLWSARWDDEDRIMFCVAKDATEKKRIEAVLGNEMQRLQELFIHAPASVGVFKGPAHVFEMANELYLQSVGRKDIIGKTVREVFPEVESQGLFELLDQVFTTGIPFTANERMVQVDTRGDGRMEKIYLNFSYHPYRDKENKIEGVFFFAVDVTEQVNARKKIEESEKRFSQFIEDLPEAVYTCNAEGKIELYNSAAVRLWGREPVIGEDYWSGSYKSYYLDGTPIVHDQGPMALAIKSGKAHFEFEVIIEHPNGEKRYARANPVPIFDKDNKLVGAVNMLVDITKLKLVEEKLRGSNERYQIVTKATNDGIWDWNLSTNEIYWNNSYERIFGYKNSNEEPDADRWFDKIHAEDRERVKNGVWDVINSGGSRWEDEYRYLKANGDVAIVYDRGYLMYNDEGKPTRFVGAMEDISERKKIENEREYLIEHLVKSNHDLKQFSYITSHNFRAPLSNLIGLLSLIDESTLTETNREIINMFAISTHQLNKTINDLVQILIIKNNINVSIVNNNITDVLNEAVSSLSHELAEVDCTINRDIRVENILLNKSYLESILINLLSNSIKYRSLNRKLIIEISTEKNASGEIVMIIRDNGSGIDMKRHKDQIFGLYQRFHDKKEGVGLGLYMVKTQIMALGGKIEVKSEEDNGTEFRVTFKEPTALLIS